MRNWKLATAPRLTTRRTRRTAEQVFLDKLSKLTHGEQTLISNSTLREALGWSDEKYHAVRTQLRHDQLINVGQGQGGKVGLAKLPNRKALKLFVSYNHVDVKYKDDLVKHIDPLRRLKLVDTWFDGKIQAGNETGKSQVIPVILRNCMWQHMPFSKLKSLPLDAKAVSTNNV
jgi:hypothetical protein